MISSSTGTNRPSVALEGDKCAENARRRTPRPDPRGQVVPAPAKTRSISRLEQLPLELKLHIFDAMQLTVAQNCRLQLVSKQLRADLTANQLWRRPLEGNWTLPLLGDFPVPRGMDAQAQATGGRSYFAAFADSMRAASAVRRRLSSSLCDRGAELFAALRMQVMTRSPDYCGAFGDAHDISELYRVFPPRSEVLLPEFTERHTSASDAYLARLVASAEATRSATYPVVTDTLLAYRPQSTSDRAWLGLLPAGAIPLALFEGLITIGELRLFPTWNRQLESSTYANLFGLLDILENNSRIPATEVDVRLSRGTAMSHLGSFMANANRNIRYSLDQLEALKKQSIAFFQESTEFSLHMDFLDFASCLARINPSAAPAISWFFFEDNGLPSRSTDYRRTPLNLSEPQLHLWCETVSRWPGNFATLPSTFRSEPDLAFRAVAKNDSFAQQVDWVGLVERNPFEAEKVLKLMRPETRFLFLSNEIEHQLATLAQAPGAITDYRKFLAILYREFVTNQIDKSNESRTRMGDEKNLRFFSSAHQRAEKLLRITHDDLFSRTEEKGWRELEDQTRPPPGWLQRACAYLYSQ